MVLLAWDEKTNHQSHLKMRKVCTGEFESTTLHTWFPTTGEPAHVSFIHGFNWPFPTTEEGNTYCLTACCVLTDYLFCTPICNKEAKTVVQAYLKNIYALFGGSKVLISDNGTEFKNSLFAKVCEVLNMTQHFITAYLPNSNLVEHHHSSLKRCIAKFCKKDASHWDEIIPYACMVQNLFPHTLKGESAMFKMFG